MQKRMRSKLAAVSLAAMMLGTSAFPALAAESVTGDVNGDGTFNISDVVLLQKWLLAVPNTTLADWKAADMYEDGRLDVFDLCLMKCELLNTVNTPDSPEPETSAAYSIIYENNVVTVKDADGKTLTLHDGISISGQTVTLTKPGEYEISGKSESGQIVVDVDKSTYPNDKVELILNGLELSNTSVSPVYVANVGDECVITVKSGSVNTITDGTNYTNADGSVGAIYSCDDLKIKGKGTLNVNANCGDGIVSKNDLRIFNGTINVNAADDAIRGKDSVRIGDPDKLPTNGGDGNYDTLIITVVSENGDGIKSNETDDPSDGFVTVNGGTLHITANNGDGIQAETELTINSGTINVEISGSNSGNTGTGLGSGSWGGWKGNIGTSDDTSASTDTGNTEGIKSTGNITVNGGDVTVNGGTSSKGFKAGGKITLNSGNMKVNVGNEGIESKSNIEINGGVIDLYAGDDGFNVGGADSADKALVMNGGFVYAQARADVMDSNGIIEFSGGTAVLVRLSITGNTAIDGSDGMSAPISFNGGRVIAIGSSKDLWSQDVAGYGGEYADKVIYNSNVGTLSNIAAVDTNENVLSFLNASYNSFNAYGILYAPGKVDAALYNNAEVSGSTNIYSDYYEGGTFESGTQIK